MPGALVEPESEALRIASIGTLGRTASIAAGKDGEGRSVGHFEASFDA
jgi:hypothetical protein